MTVIGLIPVSPLEGFPPTVLDAFHDFIYYVAKLIAALDGCLHLNRRYQKLRQSPHFTEGTPDSLGVGISIGLGSKLPFDGDYIGRPINVATRLCGVCPGGKVFVDQAVPNLDPNVEKRETTVEVKTYGKYYLWSIAAA